jgi:hypothetical protein
MALSDFARRELLGGKHVRPPFQKSAIPAGRRTGRTVAGRMSAAELEERNELLASVVGLSDVVPLFAG